MGMKSNPRVASLSKATGRSLWVNPIDAKSTQVHAVNSQNHGPCSTVNSQPKDFSSAGGPAFC